MPTINDYTAFNEKLGSKLNQDFMNKIQTLAEYQQLANRTCPDLGTNQLNELHMWLGVVTEIGETLDIFKKFFFLWFTLRCSLSSNIRQMKNKLSQTTFEKNIFVSHNFL